MSTKIYDGFLFMSPGIDSNYQFLNALRTELLPLAEELTARLHCDLAVTAYDRWKYAGESEAVEVSPAVDAFRFINESQLNVKKTGLRDPLVDFGLEVVILPADSKHTLGILYTEQEAFRKIVESKIWYIDFGYWDNSDQPDDISDSEWQRRRGLWDKALGDDGNPARHGVWATIIDNRWIAHPTAAKMLIHQPTVENRAKELADHINSQAFVKDSGLEVNAGNLIRLVSDWRAAINDPGSLWHKKYRDLVASLTSQMRPLTKEDLLERKS